VDLDAHAVADGHTLTADVCVVGAGPVGLTLADALRRRGRTVAVVESGRHPASAAHDDLNIADVHGPLGQDLRVTRVRGVGGTANVWNTTAYRSVWAKVVPLDPIDYQARDWIESSGWPFDEEEMRRWYARAHLACGIGPFDYSDERWRDAAHPSLDLHGGLLSDAAYQCVEASRFTVELPALLRETPNVTLLRGATVTGFDRDADGAIRSARWRSITGIGGTVRATSFVLAMGGIENARMLLVDARARGDASAEASWTGRGFMGHPRDVTIDLMTRAPVLELVPGFYTPHRGPDGVTVLGRLALCSTVQRELETSNASVQLVNYDEMRRIAVEDWQERWRWVPLRAVRKLSRLALPVFAKARRTARGTRYRVIINLEERPHRDNRVVLTEAVDALGMPRAALHWRWHEGDERSRVAIRQVVVGELLRLGLGRVRVRADRPLDPDAHHHVGTTRMHLEPSLGVVDADCRVHGERNLFVVGSSVFPTAGWANPTLTAIAIGLRCAERL
jgi:choline dehydrogenase-like flavoprotein